jgi:cytochrome c oxidase subunit 4
MAHVETTHTTGTVQPANKEHIRKIWITAAILGGVTALEFLIAFVIGPGSFKTSLFIGLTIVKAFYIVMEFMHLKYEVKALVWSIILPMILVVWMIIALLMEGGEILNVRF